MPNDRESKLDHSEVEGAQLRHEDEISGEPQMQEDSDEAMYDLFVGKASEREGDQAERERLSE